MDSPVVQGEDSAAAVGETPAKKLEQFYAAIRAAQVTVQAAFDNTAKVGHTLEAEAQLKEILSCLAKFPKQLTVLEKNIPASGDNEPTSPAGESTEEYDRYWSYEDLEDERGHSQRKRPRVMFNGEEDDRKIVQYLLEHQIQGNLNSACWETMSKNLDFGGERHCADSLRGRYNLKIANNLRRYCTEQEMATFAKPPPFVLRKGESHGSLPTRQNLDSDSE